MLRRSVLCYLDSMVAVRARLSPLLKAAPGREVALNFRKLVQRGDLTPGDISLVLAQCKKEGRWQRAVSVLTAAKHEGFAMRNNWHDQAVATATNPADRSAVMRQLTPFFTPLHPAEEDAVVSIDDNATDLTTDHMMEPDASKGSNEALEAIGGRARVMTFGRKSVAPTPSFDRYCLQQRLVSSPQELTKLVEAMQKKPLVAIRVHQHNAEWPLVVEQCKQHAALEPIEWYPGRLAWRLLQDAPEADEQRARYFLKMLIDSGYASFQSASSLLPPLYLLPQPGMDGGSSSTGSGELILDMCASPGSKTSQVLDLLSHSGGSKTNSFVVANELDPSRAAELRKRLGGKSPLCGFTHFDGTAFPSLPSGMCFDKVLLDAPCSGDGMLAKDRGNWRRWHPQDGVRFHHKQVRLLRRALQLTRPGGIVVYSTCTMNPLENEAVVSTMVAEGLATLLPVPRIPGLPRLRSGLMRWKVPSSDGHYLTDATSGTDHPLLPSTTAGKRMLSMGSRPSATLFPPPEATVGSVGLWNCRRVVPHQTDGMEAFFVSVLQRTSAPVRDAADGTFQGWRPATTADPLPSGHPFLLLLSETFGVAESMSDSLVLFSSASRGGTTVSAVSRQGHDLQLNHGVPMMMGGELTLTAAAIIGPKAHRRVVNAQPFVLQLLLAKHAIDLESAADFEDFRRTLRQRTGPNTSHPAPLTPASDPFLRNFVSRQDLAADGPVLLQITELVAPFYVPTRRVGGTLRLCLPDSNQRDHLRQLLSRAQRAYTAPKERDVTMLTDTVPSASPLQTLFSHADSMPRTSTQASASQGTRNVELF